MRFVPMGNLGLAVAMVTAARWRMHPAAASRHMLGGSTFREVSIEVWDKWIGGRAVIQADDADLTAINGDDSDLHDLSLLNKGHGVPIPLLPSVLELGKHNGVGEQFPLRERVSNIERDPVLYVPADEPENRVLYKFFASSSGLPATSAEVNSAIALAAAPNPSTSRRS
jgi:hypothetical protein